MARVTVKISPSLAGALNASGCEWLFFEKDIPHDATIGHLFKEMAATDGHFKSVIFCPETGGINALVLVVLNHKMVQHSYIMETKLNDGDAVMLLPVYMGG